MEWDDYDNNHGIGGKFTSRSSYRPTDQGRIQYGDESRLTARAPGAAGVRETSSAFRAGLHAGRGPKGWKRSDEIVRELVCERLADDPYIDASEMEVNVRDGIVVLRGSVPDRRMKRLAEDVIEPISGVHDIRNELRVGIAGDLH